MKSLCDDTSLGFFPPRFVYLQKLEKISIEKIDDKILLRFKGDSDISERDIPFIFFENADKNFVAAVFEDLFGNNIKKKRYIDNLTVMLSKKDFKKDKEIIVKIYDCIKDMLSKSHNVDNVNVEDSADTVYYKFISKDDNTMKRKIEVEEEEEEKSKKKKSTKKNRNNK